jgi:rhamnogalacturonan endolyase
MFRQPIELTIYCLTIVGAALASAAAVEVPNGGFEQGAASQPAAWSWGPTNAQLQVQWTKDGGHAGGRALQVRVPGELNTETGWRLTCTEAVPVPPGTYVASFWLKAACDRLVLLTVDGCQGQRVVRPRLGDGTGYCRQGTLMGFGPCDWTRFEREFVVPPGVSSLRLTFTGKLGSDLLLDDVAIRAGRLPYQPQGQRVAGHARRRVEEGLDRGLVALRRPGGVYVGWRLLREDPTTIAFQLERQQADGQWARVSAAPLRTTTDLLDTAPQAARATAYRLLPASNGPAQPLATCRVEECEQSAAYHTVRLAWPNGRAVTDVEKVGLGDLDGDGRYDFVLKHPAGDVLLYDDYTRWKPSPDTYKIDAFTADGKHLWRRDLGWGIENRNWFSPILVHDLDGDGRAEVIAKVIDGDRRNARGRVVDGAEWVAVWDGRTGKEITRAPWPSRAGFDCYNFASRNQLAVAYLDGRTPCLIVLRGTYGLMKVEAYELADRRLRPLWKFCNANAPAKYWGQGAHFTQCVDVDRDGRDEVALGSMVLDDTGVPLWSTGLGHPDGLYIGDIDPRHPGLEMYTNIEFRCQQGGMILVDAATGKTLWQLDTPTTHVHGSLCADLDPAHPGLECFGVDKRTVGKKEQIVGTWLKSAAGKPLAAPTGWGFGKPTIYWDADPQKELITKRRIHKYQGTAEWPIPLYTYHCFVPVDLLGDWREELLEFTAAGELRIHLSAIPARDRRVCLMQDRIYRSDIAMCAMAYHRPAMLSYCPAASAPPTK